MRSGLWLGRRVVARRLRPVWLRLEEPAYPHAMAAAADVAEVALYAPVKAHLERAGFVVKGEIRGCDVVGVRDGAPPVVVVCELKLGLSLELLLQAVERMALADEVWIAVASTRRGRDRDTRAHRLCRLLGIGLLAVRPRTGHVEVIVDPAPYRPRKNLRRRSLLTGEFARRRGDPTPGGASRQPIMTAYRQQSLACAAALRHGPRRPRDLREQAPDAGRILLRNVYGWFERVRPGLYRLAADGEAALARWPDGASDGAATAPP